MCVMHFERFATECALLGYCLVYTRSFDIWGTIAVQLDPICQTAVYVLRLARVTHFLSWFGPVFVWGKTTVK